jgi:hypothetical protein
MRKQCTDLRENLTKRPKRRQAKGGNDMENTIPDIMVDSDSGGHDADHTDVDLTIPIPRCIGGMRVIHVSSFDDEPFNKLAKVEPFSASPVNQD